MTRSLLLTTILVAYLLNGVQSQGLAEIVQFIKYANENVDPVALAEAKTPECQDKLDAVGSQLVEEIGITSQDPNSLVGVCRDSLSKILNTIDTAKRDFENGEISSGGLTQGTSDEEKQQNTDAVLALISQECKDKANSILENLKQAYGFNGGEDTVLTKCPEVVALLTEGSK